MHISLWLAGSKEQAVQDLEGQEDAGLDHAGIVQHPADRGEVREAPGHRGVQGLAVGRLEGLVQRGQLGPLAQQGLPHCGVTDDGALGSLLRAQQAHELAVQVAQRLDVQHALHVAVVDVHGAEVLVALVLGELAQHVDHRDRLGTHGVVEAHCLGGGALVLQPLGVVHLEVLHGPLGGVRQC